MTVTIPEPRFSTPQYLGQPPSRTRHITYTLTETGEANGTGAYESDAVQVSVYHDSSRKRFTATVFPVTISRTEGSIFTGTLFRASLMHGEQILAEPVARYSAKAIDAFVKRVVGAFSEVAPKNPRIAAWLRGEFEEN